jgi:hypothetical protein
MKHLYVILFVLSALISAQAQTDSKAMVRDLDKKTDALLDSASKHMIIFILGKDATHYDKSLNLAAEAKKNNIRLDSLSKTTHGIMAKEINEFIAEDIEEINALTDPDLKQAVLNDKGQTEKVTFKGKKYSVGKPSKDLYNKFIGFIPAN